MGAVSHKLNRGDGSHKPAPHFLFQLQIQLWLVVTAGTLFGACDLVVRNENYNCPHFNGVRYRQLCKSAGSITTHALP